MALLGGIPGTAACRRGQAPFCHVHDLDSPTGNRQALARGSRLCGHRGRRRWRGGGLPGRSGRFHDRRGKPARPAARCRCRHGKLAAAQRAPRRRRQGSRRLPARDPGVYRAHRRQASWPRSCLPLGTCTATGFRLQTAVGTTRSHGPGSRARGALQARSANRLRWQVANVAELGDGPSGGGRCMVVGRKGAWCSPHEPA